MPDDNREKERQLMLRGADIVGAGAGGIIGAIFAGPAGAIGGAFGGVLLKQILEVGVEWYHKDLAPREAKRVGAAYTLAKAAIQERLDRGEQPRSDGFFASDATDRSPAEELLEGVLLRCKNEHEEKKLRFVSNIFANAAFLDVPAADANAILSIGERLSYRQICVLAAFDGKGEFVKVMRVNNVDGLIDKLWDGGAQVLAHDVQQVFETHGLIGLSDHIGPNSPPEQIHVGLTSLGQIAFSLMGLGDVPPADGAEVVARFKVALGLT